MWGELGSLSLDLHPDLTKGGKNILNRGLPKRKKWRRAKG